MDTQDIIIAGFTVLGGSTAVTAFVTQYFLRRQTTATAEKTLAEGGKIEVEASNIHWLGLIAERKGIAEDIQKQLDRVGERADLAERRSNTLQEENFALRERVFQLERLESDQRVIITELRKTIDELKIRLEKVEQDTGSMKPVKVSKKKVV